MTDQVLTAVKELANLGAAGLMGALWLWERRLSRTREAQLTEAHERIGRDGGQLAALADLVRRNTIALTGLKETQRQLVQLLSAWRGSDQVKQ